jgi:cobalt-zinc-cadmium resistance protein CzcA
MKKVFFLILSLSLELGLNAQVAISLEDALARSERLSPGLKASLINIEQEEALKGSAWQLGNTGLFTAGEEMNAQGQGVRTTIGFSQQNMRVFAIAPALALQNENVQLAEIDYSLRRKQLQFEVQDLYTQLFVAQKRLTLYSELDSLYEQFEKAAALRYETEASSELAYIAAQNRRQQLAVQKRQAENEKKVLSLSFNALLNSRDTLFVPQDDTIQIALIPELGDASAQHPQLARAQGGVSLAERQWRMQRSGFLPQLNLQYGVQEIQGQSGFYQFQLGVQFPLLFAAQQAQTKAARLKKLKAENNLAQTELNFESARAQALQRFQTNKENWLSYGKNSLKLAKAQRVGAMKAYQAGAIDYLELIQNINEATQLELQVWSAYQDHLGSYYALLYYLNS